MKKTKKVLYDITLPPFNHGSTQQPPRIKLHPSILDNADLDENEDLDAIHESRGALQAKFSPSMDQVLIGIVSLFLTWHVPVLLFKYCTVVEITVIRLFYRTIALRSYQFTVSYEVENRVLSFSHKRRRTSDRKERN